MSGAKYGGGKSGKAAISTWIDYHRQPLQPYLRRNLERALQYATMGSAISSLKPLPIAPERVVLASEDDEEEEDEDDNPRPAKRRKTTALSPNSASGNGDEAGAPSLATLGQTASEYSNLLSGAPGRVRSLNPSDFYGSSKVVRRAHGQKGGQAQAQGRSRIDSVLKLPKEPVDFKKLLKICVTGINLNLSRFEDDLSAQNGSTKPSKIKCTLALFHVLEDDSFTDIYRVFETGTIRRNFGDQKEGVSHVSLPPFHIPAAVLYQNEHLETDALLNKSRDASDVGSYAVQLLIEPQRGQRDWLPLTVSNFPRDSDWAEKIDSGEVGLSHFHQLICEFPLFESEWKEDSARIFVIYDGVKVRTSASMMVDILWSLPSHLSKSNTKNSKPEHLRQAERTATPEAMAASAQRQHSEVVAPDSPARPGRRRGNVPTYNLKALSAKAQGKLPRAPRNRDLVPEASGPDALSVTYTLGRADSSEYGIKQQHSVAGLTCPICNSRSKTVENLRFHLTTNHTQFKFHLRRSSPPRIAFFVEFNQPNRGTPNRTANDPSRILQFGKAATLLDMEKYLNGDQSWLKSRQGPSHEQWPEHLRHQNDVQSLSPQSSCHNSPDRSSGTNGFKHSTPVIGLPLRPRKKFYVPETENRLFDLITKRILVPGEELPDSDDEKDETWLRRKQRDIVNDYTDVAEDEKDYTIRWNDYVLSLRLTCDVHLPAAIVRFVKQEKLWFAERRSRKRELLKQIEVGIMRGSITQQVLYDCVPYIREGEKEFAELERKKEEARKKGSLSPPPPSKQKKRRGFYICECGDFAPQASRVHCHERKCWARYYHKECAAKQGREVNWKTWICNNCLEMRAEKAATETTESAEATEAAAAAAKKD